MIYKVQYFNPVVYSWQDVQQRYVSVAAAQAHFKKGFKCRVMCIDGKKRYPVTMPAAA